MLALKTETFQKLSQTRQTLGASDKNIYLCYKILIHIACYNKTTLLIYIPNINNNNIFLQTVFLKQFRVEKRQLFFVIHIQ